MDIFNFEWLKENYKIKENIRDDGELVIKLFDYDTDIRFGTSPYSGYIITIKDLDTEEIISFNCDKMDIEANTIDKTYYSMLERFCIKSNGAYYRRKNIKILSLTVPKEVFIKMTKISGININEKEYKKKILY